MPVSLNDEQATLSGYVEINDAEVLHGWLVDQTDPVVDVSACTSAHTAVVQLLVLAAPRIIGAEESGDWRRLLQPPFAFQTTPSEN